MQTEDLLAAELKQEERAHQRLVIRYLAAAAALGGAVGIVLCLIAY